MKYTELEMKISQGKELFSEVIRLTMDFLDRLEDITPSEVHSFEEKRRKLLEEIISFHAEFSRQFPDGDRDQSLVMRQQLDEFRIFQEVFVQIMMEKGEEIISRANGLKDRLKMEMAVISSGKNALRGYDGKRGVVSHSINNAA